MPSLVEQPLDRPGVAVADGAGGIDGNLAYPLAESGVDRRRRRLLDQLLVAALDRAVALAEVDDVAMRVGKHLHLDVPRILEVALDVDRRVREVRLALAPGGFEGALRFLGGTDDLEALASSAGRGLDRERPAELVAQLHDVCGGGRRPRWCPGRSGLPRRAWSRGRPPSSPSPRSPRAAARSTSGRPRRTPARSPRSRPGTRSRDGRPPRRRAARPRGSAPGSGSSPTVRRARAGRPRAQPERAARRGPAPSRRRPGRSPAPAACGRSGLRSRPGLRREPSRTAP